MGKKTWLLSFLFVFLLDVFFLFLVLLHFLEILWPFQILLPRGSTENGLRTRFRCTTTPTAGRTSRGGSCPGATTTSTVAVSEMAATSAVGPKRARSTTRYKGQAGKNERSLEKSITPSFHCKKYFRNAAQSMRHSFATCDFQETKKKC